MIHVGTPCLIVFTAPHARRYIGKTCTVTKHGFYGSSEFGMQNCMIAVDSEEIPAGFKCLVPLPAPPLPARRVRKSSKVPA